MRCVDSGRVAIFDATNSTRKRRAWLKSQLESLPVKLLFIESVCTDEQIVEKNIWNAKVTLPEYADMPPEEAYRDFAQRIEFYRSVYEPMDEEDLSWIKLINCGKRVEINNIHGCDERGCLVVGQNGAPINRSTSTEGCICISFAFAFAFQ
jgi:hypothetical protein